MRQSDQTLSIFDKKKVGKKLISENIEIEYREHIYEL
jgi:hypothetical protein